MHATPHTLQVIGSDQLDIVIGGAAVNVNTGVNADVKFDVNRGIEQVGNGAGRLIGCGFGASSRREFGNCILNGRLGDVPPAPQR